MKLMSTPTLREIAESEVAEALEGSGIERAFECAKARETIAQLMILAFERGFAYAHDQHERIEEAEGDRDRS